MTPSVLRRVRWGNVARLAGAAAALALVVAWPRLRPHEPPLPPRTVLPAPRSAEDGAGRSQRPREWAGERRAGGERAAGRRASRRGARVGERRPPDTDERAGRVAQEAGRAAPAGESG